MSREDHGRTGQKTDTSEKRLTCIIDASSAIILYKTGLFPLLLDVYTIVMPVSVFEEITRSSSYPGADDFSEMSKQGRFHIIDTEVDDKIPLSLDRGEGDVISLFFNKKGNFIMIDDGAAAACCRNNKLPFINALLFPRILFLRSFINADDYNDYTQRIIMTGRYSPRIISFARCATEEDLCFFLTGM